jgi:hypothetical protein
LESVAICNHGESRIYFLELQVPGSQSVGLGGFESPQLTLHIGKTVEFRQAKVRVRRCQIRRGVTVLEAASAGLGDNGRLGARAKRLRGWGRTTLSRTDRR